MFRRVWKFGTPLGVRCRVASQLKLIEAFSMTVARNIALLKECQFIVVS